MGAGPLVENIPEAAAALLHRDRLEGPLPAFPYLEFDVQETADGEVRPTAVSCRAGWMAVPWLPLFAPAYVPCPADCLGLPRPAPCVPAAANCVP